MRKPQTKKARDRAQKLLTEFQILEPAVPIEKILDGLGLSVKFSKLDDQISGMIYLKNGSTIIGVNSMHHPNRQRFTLAHECGHYLLHSEKIADTVHVDKTYPGLFRNDISTEGVDPIEIEANQFAAELLVPEKLLINEIDQYLFDVESDAMINKLSKRFKVSAQMMSNCLSNLRLH